MAHDKSANVGLEKCIAYYTNIPKAIQISEVSVESFVLRAVLTPIFVYKRYYSLPSHPYMNKLLQRLTLNVQGLN